MFYLSHWDDNSYFVIYNKHCISMAVAILCAKVERNDITIARLNRQVTELKGHSMKNNLIFSFDKNTQEGREIDGENCIAVVKQFLGNVMHVPDTKHMYIPVAHRLGKRSPAYARSIVAKFPNALELDQVLKHSNRLRGTRHYVQRQMPPDVIERKNFAIDEFKAKRQDPQNNAKLVNEKLFIRGKLQTQYQAHALSALTVDEHSSDHEPPNITESDVILDSGSVFQSYAATVTTLNDVSAVMNNVLQKPGISSANHVVYAYRISGDSDSILENFCSDGDHGLGLELLKSMRSVDVIDTVCATTRTCDSNYIHLGKKRFQYIRDTATEALSKL